MQRLRELGLLTRVGDLRALRALLAEQARHLEGPLGLPAARIRAVADLDDPGLGQAAEQMIQRARLRARQARHRAQRDLAGVGVERLVNAAIWSGAGRVHLDPGRLLGPVLADSTCRFLGFHVGAGAVHVERRRLLAVRAVAPSLPGLAASVDDGRLRFRWRDGRGGLDFRSLDLGGADRGQVQHVVLVRPGPVVTAEPVPRPQHPPPRAPTSWFAQALADLGFHT